MQLPVITAKLRSLLSDPIETEEQVLSVLVNIRKALDCVPGLSGFSILRFHCNWMLHHALSQGGAAKLIDHVDQYQDVFDASMEENPATLSVSAFKALAKLNDLTYFRRFRSELRTFLKHYQLPEHPIGDDRWPEFLKVYISAVESTPLKYEAPKQKGNTLPPIPPDVQQITLSLLDYAPAGTVSDFRLKWAWNWPNGDPDFPLGMRRVLLI